MATKKKAPPKSERSFRDNLQSSVIAIPLLEDFNDPKKGPKFDVVIDLNLDCRGGRYAAQKKTRRLLRQMNAEKAITDLGDIPQYLFATLTANQIRKLVRLDCSEPVIEEDIGDTYTSPAAPPTPSVPPPPPQSPVRVDNRLARSERAIYRVWPDFDVELQINKSISTIKADAAHRAFSATGDGIVWAVIDSGVEHHPHFAQHRNLELSAPLAHRDFTGENQPHLDVQGHGTHVAGIIAGEMTTVKKERVAAATWDYLNEEGEQRQSIEALPTIVGIAPRCKIVSLRVVSGANPDAKAKVSRVIAALTYIQEINGHGRRLYIHGVNMSLGYPFDPEWFACGQSPICVEVERLVRTGVTVVIAAGNSGYTTKTDALSKVSFAAGENLTIKDPGNAELAITVGSTHRDMPHTYGVSYFSSKGPTGDGRIKPDLLAPGEKILSCAAASKQPPPNKVGEFIEKTKAAYETDSITWYVPQSGTSMAAPHVSGAIAAFLSIRREFIGEPEQVKKIFLGAATDLRRERYFQGSGLVDLMRAIQSV